MLGVTSEPNELPLHFQKRPRISLLKVPTFVAQRWRKLPADSVVGVLVDGNAGKSNALSQNSTCASSPEATGTAATTTHPCDGGTLHLSKDALAATENTGRGSGSTRLAGAVKQLRTRVTAGNNVYLFSHNAENSRSEGGFQFLAQPSGLNAYFKDNALPPSLNYHGVAVEAACGKVVTATPTSLSDGYRSIMQDRRSAALQQIRPVQVTKVTEPAVAETAPRLFRYYQDGDPSLMEGGEAAILNFSRCELQYSSCWRSDTRFVLLRHIQLRFQKDTSKTLCAFFSAHKSDPNTALSEGAPRATKRRARTVKNTSPQAVANREDAAKRVLFQCLEAHGPLSMQDLVKATKESSSTLKGILEEVAVAVRSSDSSRICYRLKPEYSRL